MIEDGAVAPLADGGPMGGNFGAEDEDDIWGELVKLWWRRSRTVRVGASMFDDLSDVIDCCFTFGVFSEIFPSGRPQ